MDEMKNLFIKKRGGFLLKILAGVVVVLVLLFLLNLFILPVRNFFYVLSFPIQKTFWAAGESYSSFFSSILKAGSLAKENQSLQEENQKLLSQIIALQSIEQGNKAQSDVSASCQNTGFKLLMVGVIGLDSNDILSINKGSADGVAEGMPVINQQNVLFGKVYKVYKNFSQVMLISNKNSVTNVEVLAGQAEGVVKGDGGLSAYLDLIPISSTINTQDVLVTSSIEKSFPKDLLVAKILQVQKDDQKPFQQAQISLFLDVKTADNLFVITNYKRE